MNKKQKELSNDVVNSILVNIGKKTKNNELVKNIVEKKNINSNIGGTISSTTNVANESYKKDGKTFTENLTKEEINEKLEDYKKVDDISKVILGTHLRYFTEKDGTKLFRMGGNLKNNFGLPKYVILVNALGKEWTVQTANTIFYKKMTMGEIKEEYEKIDKENADKYKKIKNENKLLLKENEELKNIIKKLEKQLGIGTKINQNIQKKPTNK